MSKLQVAVYHDEGTGEFTRACLMFALAQAFAGRASVRRIYASEIIGSDAWHARTLLLAFPGGADRPYCERLDGAGSQAIVRYLEQGGALLGVCAGAYYACARIEFEANTASAVRESRELALFAGTARGSLHDLAAPYSVSHLHCAACVGVRGVGSRDVMHALYWGGPELLPDPGARHSPLLRYVRTNGSSSLAAVVVQVGQGRAVLTGIHPEVMGCQLPIEVSRYDDASFAHGMKLSEELLSSEPERAALFRLHLNALGL